MARFSFCALALSLAFASPVPARSTGPLNVISTTWFRIIYADESSPTAALIAEHADRMFEEVTAQLGPSFKSPVPVYITTDQQVLNAYFSPLPYNRIVLFDTAPLDGQLGGFRDTILAVFYHELVHAVSLNIRSPFMHFVSGIIGDIVSVNSAITMPLSFIEGVTVSLESADGAGRLNDPLAMHVLYQDRIEDRFPNWKEAAGARDVWPGATTSYLYGGAFSAWLQQTYGMERYAQLWQRGGAFNPFTSYLQVRFYQVYGRHIGDAWNEFHESIPVPEPLEQAPEIVQGTIPGVILALAHGPDGIAWADANTASVWFLGPNGQRRRLFAGDRSLHRLDFSPDGQFLLVSAAALTGSDQRLQVRIFDIAARRFLPEIYPDVRDAVFFGSSRYILAVRSRGQYSHLVLLDRFQPAIQRILYSTGPQLQYYSLFSPVYAGADLAAVIAANGPDRVMLIADTATGTVSSIKTGENLPFIRHLSSKPVTGGAILSFIWAPPGGLYRPAWFDARQLHGKGLEPLTDASDTSFEAAEKKTVSVQILDQNRSGGFFLPVSETPSNTGMFNLLFVSSLSGRDHLSRLEIPENAFDTIPVSVGPVSGTRPLPRGLTVIDSGDQTPDISLTGARLYNPLPWMLRGVFLPFPIELSHSTWMGSWAPGFLYITGDPAERWTVVIQPAVIVEPFFLDTVFSLSRRFFSWSAGFEFEDHLLQQRYNKTLYRETTTAFSVHRQFVPGVSWQVLDTQATIRSTWYSPETPANPLPYQAPVDSGGLAVQLDSNWSAVQNRVIGGPIVFSSQRSGYAAGLSLWNALLFNDSKPLALVQGRLAGYAPLVPLTAELSLSASNRIFNTATGSWTDNEAVSQYRSSAPRFVPVLPEYAGSIYESAESTVTAGVQTELSLLAIQIQRSPPLASVYFNRFSLAGGYRALWFYDASEADILDSVYARASLTGSVVLGALTNIRLQGSAEYAWALRAEQGRYVFSFGYMIDW